MVMWLGMRLGMRSALANDAFGVFAARVGLAAAPRILQSLVVATATTLSASALAQQTQTQAQPQAQPQAPAPTQPSPADVKSAKKYFDTGVVKYQAKEYGQAAGYLEASAQLNPLPETYRYIGLCYDALDKPAPALEAYEKFLAAPPPNEEKQTEEVKVRVAAIKAIPGKVRVEVMLEGGVVSVDGKEVGALPQETLELPAGKHEVRVAFEGYDPIVRDIDVPFAGKVLLQIPIEPPKPLPPPPPPKIVERTPPPPPPPPPAPPPSKVPLFLVGGATVVAGIVGIAFGSAALVEQSNFNKNPTVTSANNANAFAEAADVGFSAMVALGVIEAVMLFTRHEDASKAKEKQEPKTPAVSATPLLSPHVQGLAATLRF